MRFKTLLILSTALSGSFALASGAAAQQATAGAQATSSTAPRAPTTAAAPGNGTSVEEVVVTARGRNEQLQNVPIAVTAFSAQQIERAHIREVGDFINLTPNVSITQAQDVGLSLISIRGVTQVRNSESPVAIIVDGVAESNPVQFAQALFDLESIEVLKGPQGALYGRNAEGGAIMIKTQQPTNEFQGHADVGGGSGGEFDAQGVVSGPIVKDQLLFRLGVNYVTLTCP